MNGVLEMARVKDSLSVEAISASGNDIYVVHVCRHQC